MDIVERLNLAAISTSETEEKWSKAKSIRQDHNPPRDDLYSWPTPEQTMEGVAAAEITELRTRLHKAVEAFSEAMEENERLKEALRDSVGKATKMQGNEK